MVESVAKGRRLLYLHLKPAEVGVGGDAFDS